MNCRRWVPERKRKTPQPITGAGLALRTTVEPAVALRPWNSKLSTVDRAGHLRPWLAGRSFRLSALVSSHSHPTSFAINTRDREAEARRMRGDGTKKNPLGWSTLVRCLECGRRRAVREPKHPTEVGSTVARQTWPSSQGTFLCTAIITRFPPVCQIS